MPARIISLNRCERYSFSKMPFDSVQLIAGFGVDGDIHAGKLVQHRYDVKKNPHARNLRQVHLIDSELLEALSQHGHPVQPGNLGENITTHGLDLLALPLGTRLKISANEPAANKTTPAAVLELTGLRAPCVQIDGFQKGLRAASSASGRKATGVACVGVMAIVLTGGQVHIGDTIEAELPAQPWHPMVCI